jgi:hypothetical protein
LLDIMIIKEQISSWKKTSIEKYMCLKYYFTF